MSVWPYQGLPDNPVAWLSRVARNRAIDRLRHENRERDYDVAADQRFTEDALLMPERGDMEDPELSTIFLCCHPRLGQLDQLAITLRVVGGFTSREISSVFIMGESALAKRLTRARQRIKQTPSSFLTEPSADDVKARLEPALKVVYLMFSLGYAPAMGEQLIRRDVAYEALRLVKELCEHPLTSAPATHALAALLYFQASRFDARENAEGEPILFRDQDRALWDQDLIAQALVHLRSAASGSNLSRYHLEAGIAAQYASAPNWNAIDWQQVLGHYRLLQEMTGSPVVTINASVALALSGDPQRALRELMIISDEPRLQDYAPFHIARAEILRLMGRKSEAVAAYNAAMTSRVSAPVLHHLEQRLARHDSASVVQLTESSSS